MYCPICKTANYKEGINCPMRKEVICMNCCKTCKYHSDDVYSPICRFHIENPHHSIETKIESLTKRIDAAENEVRRLYHYRRFDEARKLEMKIQKMGYEKRLLEQRIKNA